MIVPKLNQIVAVVNGKKTKTQKALTEIYQSLSKPTLFEGILKTYKPVDEMGETQPDERKNVQFKATDALKQARAALTELLDVTATLDSANTQAHADVKVDGVVILRKLPVSTLLFLEKQLTDIHTFIGKLPTLDPADNWEYSPESDSYRSDESVRNSTKKVMRNHVKAKATDKHPEQVDVYTEDVKVGEWKTVKFSGAVPAQKRNALLSRVEKLQEGLKQAREEANLLDVTDLKIADDLFDYILG
jgi:hypothetical protein